MMIVFYNNKKDLVSSIGRRLDYKETSFHGQEYKSNGKFCVSNRPSLTGLKGREFFAEITMENDLIKKVN